MQIIDPTAVTTRLVIVGLVSVAAVALMVLALPGTLQLTRRDRVARHESIPTYDGRLHFAD
ncbi:MAG: hypothetical protein LH477_03030 [Nocardioides sp.]|nr:hypothetical protein [Nocardioides sp.]